MKITLENFHKYLGKRVELSDDEDSAKWDEGELTGFNSGIYCFAAEENKAGHYKCCRTIEKHVLVRKPVGFEFMLKIASIDGNTTVNIEETSSLTIEYRGINSAEAYGNKYYYSNLAKEKRYGYTYSGERVALYIEEEE